MRYFLPGRRLVSLSILLLASALASMQVQGQQITSDEFAGASLDPAVWVFVNPVGDGSYQVSGGQLSLSVPAGSKHDPYTTNNSARVMQAVSDQDFEIEVKFDSGMSQKYQIQGVIAQQDDNTFVRADFYHDGSSYRIYSAYINDGSASTKANLTVSGTAPMYLRLSRAGSSWTHSYSFDGVNWQVAASFTQPMPLAAIGVFSGNNGSGGSVPAHTAAVDYFHNVAPAGPFYTLTTTVGGSGTVAKNPDQSSYASGSVVQLTAQPALGWEFDGWSGGATGFTNPLSVTVTGNTAIQANFVEASAPQYTVTVNTDGSGTVVLDPAGGTYPVGTEVTLTAQPAAGWSFDGWSGGLTGTSNPAVLTVNSDTTVTAHFVETPPPQYSLSVGTVGSGTVSLNPPGGTYEAGTEVQLTAAPAAGWAFSGWSGALSGTTNPATLAINQNESVTATFVETPPPSGGAIVADGFDAPLDPGVWTFVNPVGDGSFQVTGGHLAISVPAGSKHDPYTTNNSARVMQVVSDQDFEIEVKFDSSMSQKYQIQGVIAQQDDNTFVRADFYHDGSSYRIYSAYINDGSASTKANFTVSGTAPMYLRLARAGNSWTHRYSFDGVNWQTAASFTQAMPLAAIGVFVGNNGNPTPGHTALIDYFANVGSSGPTYTLATTTSGSGTVAKSPDQASYSDGALVQVTAQPAAGWVFDSWSGDLTGTTNPATVTMSANRSIQANFVEGTPVQYTLTTNTSGSGSIALSPSGGTYAAGTQVTLTATPAAGWSFSGWSGGATGTSNPTVITVNSNTSVTATFVQTPPTQYNLTVNTSGSGSVALNPPGGTYDAGSSVQLTATPAPGWTFSGWSGALTGTTNPANLLMSQNRTVTATFTSSATLAISNINVQSTGSTTGIVTWTTNLSANSRVDYGSGSTLTANRSSAAFVTSHSLDLAFLRCEQSYSVKVTSVTSSGTQATQTVPFTSSACPNPGVGVAPAIDVWTGSSMTVGDRGQAQEWVNVLGRVSTAHTLASLSYTLNGGLPHNLSWGADLRRLGTKGDFNAEIAYADLTAGVNYVEITAHDTDGRSTMVPVTITLVTNPPPSLPYTANWSGGNVDTYAYSVDGIWTVDGNTVAPNTLDYDRLIVLGDVTWTDYEVTVPVTINELGPHAYTGVSGFPLVGIAMRWLGHQQRSNEQPGIEVYPTGALAWYRFGSNRFELYGNNNTPVNRQSFNLQFGTTYIFKMQAVTLGNGSTRYRFKAWAQSSAEPTQWLTEITYIGGPPAGAIGIVTHHSDAHFGNVNVTFATTP